MRLAAHKPSEGLQAFFLMLIFFLTLTLQAHAASLSIQQQGVNEEGALVFSAFAITDRHNPFNAARGVLKTNFQNTQIENIKTDDSIFNLWNISPSFNEAGDVVFSGGTSAAGGFIFSGKLFDIIVTNEVGSSGNFTFTDSKLLASDGEGTNILERVDSFSFATSNAVPVRFDTDESGDVSIQELSIGLVSP